MELIITGSLLENFTWEAFKYYMFWAFVGQLLSYLMKGYKDFPDIVATGGWQWGFFIKDNWKRFSLTLLVMCIGVLFTEPVLELMGITGVKLNELTAIGMGCSTDMMIDRLRKGYFKRQE